MTPGGLCDYLTRYADGELDDEPGIAAAFRDHLPYCPPCRLDLRQHLELTTRLAQIEEPTTIRRIMVDAGGTDPSVLIVDVDPPLAPGEVEITAETTLAATLAQVALAHMGKP
jgi:hypothetical protein